MDNININTFKVNQPVKLNNISTSYTLNASKQTIKEALNTVREDLSDLQDRLYAHGKYAVLVCLQGMDTAGKDSLIREVFKDFNTRGIIVHSFKTPSTIELKHDYLWRHYIALPPRGKFAVFNRTHYENVLVTRVHPEYILNENLPEIKTVSDINKAFWQKRFNQINNFEKHISDNGTIIFKFFLHLSKTEQRNRLLRRLEKKEKNWKFSPGDLDERKLWESYQNAYEDAINQTATNHAPWHIIPADHKPTARYIVARVLWDVLKTYTDIKEPELSPAIKANIDKYIAQLKAE